MFDIERFQCRSLPIAAALMAGKHKMLDAQLCADGKHTFFFEDVPALRRTVASYATGKLKVNLIDYMRAFDELRSYVRRPVASS